MLLTSVPATVMKISTMADKSIRVVIDTQELPAEFNQQLFALVHQFGYFYFAEAPFMPDDVQVPAYVKEFKTDKTPSERLRGVLYRVWEQTDRSKTSDQFYRDNMDLIIDNFKKLIG